MAVHIHTGYNRGFEWTRTGNFRCIGYFTPLEGSGIPASIGESFSDCRDYELFRKQVSNLNGRFSLILQNGENSLMAASCAVRYFPLFYAQKKNGDLFLSDDVSWVARNLGCSRIDPLARMEFMAAGFTSNNRTLYDGVFQIRPGETLSFEGGKVRTSYYYHFSKTKEDINREPGKILRKQAVETINRVFDGYLSPLRGKQVALALSGGYDSRLIAVKLKELGFSDVVCFTYGTHTPEVDLSERVARKLGFDWHFIEYNADLIKDYLVSEEFRDYYEYAARGNSMFYLQEFPAVNYLLKQGIISPAAISFPGHSGGLLRGTFLIKYYPEHLALQKMPDLLLKQKFFHHSLSYSGMRNIREDLRKHLNELNYRPGLLPYSLLEDWEIKERTSKYIFNSSHVFTYFGIKTYFPLADHELLNFFRGIPFAERAFGKLYKEVLAEEFFDPFGVDFADDIQPGSLAVRVDAVKRKIRPYLPSSLKRKLLERNDWPYYGPMTTPLLNELENAGISLKENGASYLSRILRWYLYKVENNL